MTLAQGKTTSPVGNEWLPKVVTGLTGAGTSQGTGLVIPAGQDCSIFTTVASGTAAILPGGGVSLGEEYVIANHGANALLVFPASTHQVGTAGTNASYSLAAGKTGYFVRVGNTQWTANP